MAKNVYLTIDDGPSVDAKIKIDFLLSKNIPAVWFCQGNFLEERGEYMVYAIKKGYIIGNHSYSHPHFSDLTLGQCLKEIRKTDKIIDEIYKKANVKRPAKFFRFPHGDKGGLKGDEVFEPYEVDGKIRKEKIQEFLKNLGYFQPKFAGITYKYYRRAGLLDDIDFYWTFDVMEYELSLSEVFKRMDENIPEGARGLNYNFSEDIILLHDHTESTSIFKPIIECLIHKGLIFKVIPF